MEVSMSRQKHSEEFKREAVRLTYEPGRTLKEIGDHLGINASMLWCASPGPVDTNLGNSAQ